MDSALLVEPLLAHPSLPALTSLVRASAIDAAIARRADYALRQAASSGPALGTGHIPEGLTSEDAETPFGNVLGILQNGVVTPEERALLGALLALSLRSAPPPDDEGALELAHHLIWLAAHTPCDALSALDAALGDDAAPLWNGVALTLASPESRPADFARTEALVAAAALRRSSSQASSRLRFQAAGRSSDPAVELLLVPSSEELGGELWGELQTPPRGTLLTIVLAVTLLLFVLELLRLIGRYALMYRRPASIRLAPQGVEIYHRIELMGRVLRDRSTVVPFANLVRVTREVKYARAGLYVGLAALTLGTYFGTGLFVDGLRVPGGSGPLLGLAALFIVAGLSVDFVLSSAGDSLRGRCRVVIVPVRGRSLCIGGLDPVRADALLAALIERAGEPEIKTAAVEVATA